MGSRDEEPARTWLEQSLTQNATEALAHTDWGAMEGRVHSMLAREYKDNVLGIILGLGVTAVAALVFHHVWLRIGAVGLAALALAGGLMALRTRARNREVSALERVESDLCEYLRRYFKERLREARFMVAAWLGCGLVWLGSLIWYGEGMDLRKLIFCAAFGVFLLGHALFTQLVTVPKARRELEGLG